VNLRYDRDLEDVRRKVALDLEYIERRSVREDLTILLKTRPVVIFRSGAC
jgi:lipopolysaccharide/colanic/teichoic acid biosynthesis glycosyltransferase